MYTDARARVCKDLEIEHGHWKRCEFNKVLHVFALTLAMMVCACAQPMCESF